MLEVVGTASHHRFLLDVDVRVGAETVAVVGDNGTGKSTLLRVVAGLHRLQSGFVRMNDRVLDNPSTRDFVAPHLRGVAMLFQDPLLFAHMSVLDNVAFTLRRSGISRDVASEAAMTMLGHLAATALASRRPDTLSGGEAQRVALARALVGQPRIILLDEPFSSLDRTARNEFRRLLQEEFAALSIPRLIVTHDDADIAALCSREIVLRRNDRQVERTTGFEPATLTLAR